MVDNSSKITQSQTFIFFVSDQEKISNAVAKLLADPKGELCVL